MAIKVEQYKEQTFNIIGFVALQNTFNKALERKFKFGNYTIFIASSHLVVFLCDLCLDYNHCFENT